MSQCILILVIAILGECLSNFISFPIPKTIIASIILFFLLEFKIIKVEFLGGVIEFCRKNLAFFFMPVGIGIMKQFNSYPFIIYIKIFIVMIASTFCIMLFTGKMADLILKIQEKLFREIKRRRK